MTRSPLPSSQNMPVTAKELVQLDHLGAHAEELVQLADMELVLQGMGSVQVYPWPCFAAGAKTLWMMHPQSAVLCAGVLLPCHSHILAQRSGVWRGLLLAAREQLQQPEAGGRLRLEQVSRVGNGGAPTTSWARGAAGLRCYPTL